MASIAAEEGKGMVSVIPLPLAPEERIPSAPLTCLLFFKYLRHAVGQTDDRIMKLIEVNQFNAT